jgi:hypothetical protein
MLVDESGARTFYVDDASSQKAKVVPFRAHVIAANTSSWTKPSPRILAFLRERGLEATNRSRRYKEERLVLGRKIYILGQAGREPGPPAHDGYRATSTTRLVLAAGAGEAGELILSDLSEQKLVGRLQGPFVVGVFCIITSASLLILAWILA